MNITYQGQGDFKIKCKEGSIILGDKNIINNFTIPGAGEFEVGGVSVESIDGIFTFNSEDMNLTYLKRKKALNQKELERVKETDILFVPVGVWMDAKMALETIGQIEPRVVIPMFYDNIEAFTKMEGIKPTIVDQYKISKSLLPAEGREVVAFNAEK